MRRHPTLLVLLGLLLALGACSGPAEPEPASGLPPQDSGGTSMQTSDSGAAALVGTQWRAGGMTIAFREQGQAVVDGGTEAQWTYNAGQVTVESGGDSYVFVLEDGALRYGEWAAERLP